jgi:hypothetical protein
VTARPDKRDQPTRGQGTWDRTREAAPEPAPGSKADRDAHVKELSDQFEPDTEPGF